MVSRAEVLIAISLLVFYSMVTGVAALEATAKSNTGTPTVVSIPSIRQTRDPSSDPPEINLPLESLSWTTFRSRITPRRVEAMEIDYPNKKGTGFTPSLRPPAHINLIENDALHPVFEASRRAFAAHRSLVLSPDVIWLTIAQGFGRHINENAEALRGSLVKHKEAGKKKRIEIIRNGLMPIETTAACKDVDRTADTKTAMRCRIADDDDASVMRDEEDPVVEVQQQDGRWRDVFPDFRTQIAAELEDPNLAEAFRANFTTSTPISEIAADIVLMDAVKAYFEYSVGIICYIPSVVLRGTAEDWRTIRSKTDTLGELVDRGNLEWWLQPLREVLDHFVRAAEAADRGEPSPPPNDVPFWQSWIQKEDMCGHTSHYGGVMALFPYLKDPGQRNPAVGSWKQLAQGVSPYEMQGGPDATSMPGPLAKAPFVWENWKETPAEINMQFVAGPILVGEHLKTAGSSRAHTATAGGTGKRSGIPVGALEAMIGYIVASDDKANA